MKKFSFAICLVAIMILTGCGKKGSDTVVCTMSEETSGIEMKQEITLSFKSDKFDSAAFVMTAVIPDEYKSYKSVFVSSIESQFDSFEETYGTKINVKETSDGVKVDFKMDKSSFDKMYGSSTASSSKKETVDSMKEAGYTCK